MDGSWFRGPADIRWSLNRPRAFFRQLRVPIRVDPLLLLAPVCLNKAMLFLHASHPLSLKEVERGGNHEEGEDRRKENSTSMTIPILCPNSEPSPFPRIRGKLMTRTVMVVMTIGRKRSRADSVSACTNGIFPRRSTTKSRYRMAFFAERPISISMPRTPKMSRLPPVK